MTMINKELAELAIKNSEAYSRNQLLILELLINISSDNLATASPLFIEERTGVKKPTIYFALKTFQKDNLLSKDPNSRNSFIFNEDKINHFIQLYQNKQAV